MISDQNLELHIERKLNLESSFMADEWKFYDKMRNIGEKRKISPADNAMYLRQILDLHLNLRTYSLHEMIRILKQAGWHCVSKYGDIVALEPFNRGSRNMVLVSQKMI